MTMQSDSKSKRPRRMAREPQAIPPDTPLPANGPIAVRPQTKASLVEGLLAQDLGASLDDMCQATGWLPHTCRAFLTSLRKKGVVLEKLKRADVTCYRIADAS